MMTNNNYDISLNFNSNTVQNVMNRYKKRYNYLKIYLIYMKTF